MTEQTTETTNTETTDSTTTPGVDTTQTTNEQTQQQQENNQVQISNVPATAGEYEIKVDGFDADVFKTENGAVLDRFHTAGLSNDQVSEVVKIWDEFQQTNIESLQTEWGNDYAVNVGFAQNAIKAMGFKPEELDSPTALIRFASAVGKTLQEDLPPSNTQQSTAESVESLRLSEAYNDPKHPEYKAVMAKIEKAYQKQYG